MQQHQREETAAFGVLWVDCAQHTSKANGLGTKLTPDERVSGGGGIALVEDEIDDHLHRSAALGQSVLRWYLIGDARILDRALGAHEALRQSGLSDEKRARDLLGRQAAESAQRQGNLRLAIERGMAAREDQPQAVIGDPKIRIVQYDRVLIRPNRGFLLQLRLFFAPRALTPPRVDQLPVCGSGYPGSWIVGNAARRPITQRRGESLLHRLLGAIEGAAQPDQAGNDPAVFAAKHRFKRSANVSRLRHQRCAPF